jgi:uncharacterized membrane protein YbaN (DUF454 family)
LIGIVVPGLPTTPFLLLTAALYIRSSQQLHDKLLANRVVGRYIRDFYDKKGMTWKGKVGAILTMWVMISLSTQLFIDAETVKYIVVGLGVVGTTVITVIIPTVK